MKGERLGSVLIRTGLGLFLAALAVSLTASPAAAASGDDVKGWIAAVDLALTQPAGLEQEYAFQSTGLSSPIQGRRLLIDNSADSTFRLSGAYSFGPGLGRVQVSWWSFDHGDSESNRLNGYVFPSLFGYGVYSTYVAYLNDPAGVPTAAHSNVKADTLDLDYSRATEVGENFTFRWLAGLRTATFKEEITFSGTASGGYVPFYFVRQRRHMDANAFGPKVGGRGTFAFTPRFSLEGGVALSLLRADVKGDSSQAISGLVTSTERNRAEDKNGRGQILDMDVRGVWTAGSLSIYLGYSLSSWEGLVRDPNPPRSAFYPLVHGGGGRDSVSFDSFNVGVIYRFGAPGLHAP